MAGVFENLFGGAKPSASNVPAGEEADFADFAGAPDPQPASFSPVTPSAASAAPAFPTQAHPALPYTKWYRVWERASIQDFKLEMYILPIILVIVLVHLWGAKANRRRAKHWIAAHAPSLEKEFASVGFGGRKAPSIESVQQEGLAKASVSDDLIIPEELLKERTLQEFTTYATGRQNVAFIDLKLSLLRRFNPFALIAEHALGFFFESMPAPIEKMEVVLYAFDGKEKELVPVPGGKRGQEILDERNVKYGSASTYDGFVFAIVNKDLMRSIREERYDISLTTTKNHQKIPQWATVMSESAEVTEMLLTPELVSAVEKAGDALEYLIVTDQPVDKPLKLNETIPKKRIHLSLKLPSGNDYSSTIPLFNYVLRLPDQLVSQAHFRPEVMRRIRQTREDEIRKLRRVDEEEKAEERKVQAEREKKAKREAALKNLSADEQRKFLEREREKELKKSQKKMSRRV
ncbi:DUF1682-domain-containing protein [Xylona heveae TC161]|uniref:DUF1682-domain-containing protein n=1 Tax=Xylona heveae (strain CBS 132557 / TC161) TaxID=1328760 RepID=A0A165G4M6_XYLHT|nr:DUF1682-domain-containing protein [Xylona heveae TC161]KZF21733.1 DUF1682-domain-containing protein [Xylona heveae TC161]